MKNWFSQARMVLIVAAIWIALDQLSKYLVRQNLPLHESLYPIPALSDFLIFQHVKNYGAAFGILQNQGNLFVVIAIVVIIAILFYVRHLPPDQALIRFLLGMQLGGAAGNLIDRIHQGFVTDFVRMGIPGIYYIPNFNVADSGIVLGVIGLGIFIILEDIKQQRRATQTATNTSEA